jgi:hypothetical protein
VNVEIRDLPGIALELPDSVGEWSGQRELYCYGMECGATHLFAPGEIPRGCPRCGEALKSMSRIERDVLGADTESLKSLYSHPGGATIHVTIVLSNRERNSIHRPQRCLTAQGFSIGNSRVVTVGEGAGGSLDIMVLDLTRPYRGGSSTAIWTGSFLYWFVGQGRQTPYHGTRMFWMAWDRILHSRGHRWAYIALQTAEPHDSRLLDGFLLGLRREWYEPLRAHILE